MPKFSANLTMLFNEVEFLERFERAARAGFNAVEVQFPYEWLAPGIEERLRQYKLKLVLINAPAGDWAGGERGIACLPDRVADFRKGVELAILYARALDCHCVNCLAGITPKDIAASRVRQTLVENLRWAADRLENEGIRLLSEPLNSQDIPRFLIDRTPEWLRLAGEVGHKNLWLQYDIYHMQVMEGNLAKTIRDNVGRIAHMQLADNPGRREPGTGEINFPNLFRFIDEAGYDGWIGAEYRPAGKTEDGLGWVKPYLESK